MRKIDYEILAAAIKKHGLQNLNFDYASQKERDAAKNCAYKIAGTFAHFASVNKPEFIAACGIKP